MNFLYRMHEGFSRGNSIEGFDSIRCLRNFLSCIDNKDKLIIFIDNSSDEFCQTIKNIHPNIIRINLGNCNSFLYAVNYAINHFNSEERVYLIENDYLHKPNIEKYLEDGFNTGAQFVSLYDHPALYNDIEHPYLLSKIFLGKKAYWRVTPYTCMTFATTVRRLIMHRDLIIEACTQPETPLDVELFNNIQQTGDILVSSMPGRATHLVKNLLSPFVDWSSCTYV
jgi:hypothetical protein